MIYTIVKYVSAPNLKAALRKDKDTEVSQIYLTDGSINLLHDKLLK